MHSCKHARFKVPADGNVLERVSLSDGRASSDVTGCKRGRVADSALPHLPLCPPIGQTPSQSNSRRL